MDLRRDRKRSLKFRKMLESQGYKRTQGAEETKRSPVKEKVHILRCALLTQEVWLVVFAVVVIGSVNLNQLVIQRQEE